MVWEVLGEEPGVPRESELLVLIRGCRLIAVFPYLPLLAASVGGRRGYLACALKVGVGEGLLPDADVQLSFVSLHGSLLPSTIFWPLSLLIPLKAPRPPRPNSHAKTSGRTPPSGRLVSNSLPRLDTGYFLLTVCF